MSIRIGHASIDERGKASGGTPGDQTGKEVCIRSWYSRPWSLLLRHPDPRIAERAARACEAACANPNIGYDQIKRNTAYTEAKRHGYSLAAIDTPCATDCSAFVTLCYIAAGVTALAYTDNAPTTATMRSAFTAAGFTAYTADKYLTGTDHLRRGDILVRPGSHTVMVLDNGARIAAEPAAKSDAAPSPWAADAWEYCRKFAYLDGTRPHDPVTREELSVVVYRLRGGA